MQRLHQVVVTGVAVPHDRPRETGQHLTRVDIGRGPATGVQVGQELGARHVHVGQVPFGAGGGLISVQHLGLTQQYAYPVHERAQQASGLAPYPGNEPDRHVHAQHRGDQLPRPVRRNMVAAHQVRRVRVGVRPVLGSPRRPRRRLTLGQGATPATTTRLNLELCHPRPRRRRRRVEHLPTIDRLHRRIRQVRRTIPATQRRAYDRLVRVGDPLQGRPRRTRLLARLPPGLLPQRPVSGLLTFLGVRAVRRRGLARVRRVPPCPPLQLADPIGKLGHLPVPLGQHSVAYRQLRRAQPRLRLDHLTQLCADLPQMGTGLPLGRQRRPQLLHIGGKHRQLIGHEDRCSPKPPTRPSRHAEQPTRSTRHPGQASLGMRIAGQRRETLTHPSDPC